LISYFLDLNIESQNEYNRNDDEIGEAPWEHGELHQISQYELAISGNAFQFMINSATRNEADEYHKSVFNEVIKHAKIYTRMSPDHKALLIEQLQNSLQDMVAM